MGTIGKLYGSMLNVSKIVAGGRNRLRRKKGVDSIICGHTHKPMIQKNEEKRKRDLLYKNTGCWTLHTVSSYVTIDEEHGAILRRHTRQKMD